MPLPAEKREASPVTATTPASPTSSNAVLNITELLEEILDHLSWKELFTFRRVCRRFNELITDSKPLREKTTLFRPEPETPLSNDEVLHRIAPDTIQRLLLMHLMRNESAQAFGLADKQRISPLLEPWNPAHIWSASGERKPNSAPFTFKFLSGERWRLLGSWRQMYLTDPPVKQAKVRLWWGIKAAGFCSFQGYIQDEDGITFGTLLDLVLEQSTQPWTFTGCTHQVGTVSERALDLTDHTPAETILRLERRFDGQAELHGEKSRVVFGCSPP